MSSRVISAAPVLVTLAATLIYLGVLIATYSIVIPKANYFPLKAPILIEEKVVEAAILLAAVVILAPTSLSRLSTIAVWGLLLLSFVPQLAIYAMRDEDRGFMWATAGVWAAVCVGVRLVPDITLPEPGWLTNGIGRKLAFTLYFVLAAAGLLAIAVYAGTGVFREFVGTGLNLSGAYDNRAAFNAARVPLHGYFLHWTAIVLNPAMFVLAVLRRRWALALLVVVFELLISSFVGLRSYFFAIAFAGFVAFIAGRRHMPELFAAALSLVALSGTAWFYWRHDASMFLLLTARFLFDPARLNFGYFHFFSTHPVIPLGYLVKYYLYLPVHWPYPYSQSPDLVLGQAVYGVQYAAVDGLVADAFMNFSWFGLPAAAVAVVLIAKLLDATARRLDIRLAAAATAMLLVALAGTYLVRALFSSGLIVDFVFLYLLSCGPARRPASERKAPN